MKMTRKLHLAFKSLTGLKNISRGQAMMICLLLVSALFFNSINVNAASGNAKVYYLSSLGSGQTAGIRNNLESMGYSVTRTTMPTKAGLKSAYQNNKIVYLTSHGSTSGTTTCSDGSLSYNDITANLSNLKFAFVDTCYSAYTPSGGMSMTYKIYNRGASSTLGFTGTVTMSSYPGGGCDYFALGVFQYAYSGYTIGQSVSYSKADMMTQYGQYYGVDTAKTYGTSITIY